MTSSGVFFHLRASFNHPSEKGAFLLAVCFAIFVSFLEEKVFLMPQGYQLLTHLARGGTNLASILLTTLTSFCLLVFLTWLSLSLPRRGRFVFILLFMVPIFVEFSYWKAFHRPFSVTDLDTALKSPLRMWNSASEIFFNRAAFLPVIVYALLLLLPGFPNRRRALGLATCIALCVGVNLLVQTERLDVNWGTSIPRFYKTVVDWKQSGAQAIERETLPAASSTRPTNNLVLIIDESIRSDHLSINGYDRPTTPYLDALVRVPGLVHNWGTAASGATCSPLSNALLITGVQVNKADRDRLQTLVKSFPTLFQYAKAMGYRTTYIDGQTNYLWNDLSLEDLTTIDEWQKTDPNVPDLLVDQRTADWIHRQVTTSNGNFIVLNKKGVHFLYEDSYPASAAVWEPIPTDYHTQPERVKNAYDNGIRFNVDVFFQHLLPDTAASTAHTMIVYTSDHGQTLFEGGVDWLHCNYTTAEASVPLILIGRLPFEPDTTYPASHSSIFPTLLDLMSVPQELRRFDYAPSLLKLPATNPSPRFYLSGDGSLMPFDR
jgi:glucan phosphoethanolaminetransferase (alkaline phosphatase superfamily)